MNLQLIFDIVQLWVSVAKNLMSGTAEKDLTVAAMVVAIIQKSALVYKQHTGEALDPNLILAEAPL